MLDEQLLNDAIRHFAPDTIIAVTPVQSIALVADHTEKYFLQTTGNDFFLIISGIVSPLLVKRGVDRQREAKARLADFAAQAIELPVVEGFVDGKSYAIWPRRQPLSGNRFYAKIQMEFLKPSVYRWLRAIASQAIRPDTSGQALADLERLKNASTIPASIKKRADEASTALRSGAIVPLHVVQHGDLWKGNILRAPNKIGFIIVDWAGAKIDGAPFFDLVRFAQSVGASRPTLHREIAAHSTLLGCDPKTAFAYVISGLAALFRKLEHFPENRFVEMSEEMLGLLAA